MKAASRDRSEQDIGETRHHQFLSPIEEVIEDARNGRMFILVDAEERENEGDLVIPAQMATPDAINFMAKHGRGLICLALTPERAKQLHLELMSRSNRSRHSTAFTVSIEAREGVSTGISAHDRAHTISVAIDPTKDYRDIMTPGPCVPAGRQGRRRAGARRPYRGGGRPRAPCRALSGRRDLRDHERRRHHGAAARPDRLRRSATGSRSRTIADLIAYRLRYDHLVKVVAETKLDSAYGGAFDLKVYATTVDPAEHVALVKGDVASGGPVLVRVHAMNTLDDVFSSGGHRETLVHKAMDIIGDARGAA